MSKCGAGGHQRRRRESRPRLKTAAAAAAEFPPRLFSPWLSAHRTNTRVLIICSEPTAERKKKNLQEWLVLARLTSRLALLFHTNARASPFGRSVAAYFKHRAHRWLVDGCSYFSSSCAYQIGSSEGRRESAKCLNYAMVVTHTQKK